MKKTVNCEFLGGGRIYRAPEIEMYESVVERGFQNSPGSDPDGLSDIDGENVTNETSNWGL